MTDVADMVGGNVGDGDLDELVERTRGATRALIKGDVRGYFALVNEAPDYTLMPPTGGPTRHGSDTSPETVEALEEFFAGDGAGDFDLEQSYASDDLAVLVGVWVLAGLTFQATPKGFLPEEDQGAIFTILQLPEGASQNRTAAAARQVCRDKASAGAAKKPSCSSNNASASAKGAWSSPETRDGSKPPVCRTVSMKRRSLHCGVASKTKDTVGKAVPGRRLRAMQATDEESSPPLKNAPTRPPPSVRQRTASSKSAANASAAFFCGASATSRRQ